MFRVAALLVLAAALLPVPASLPCPPEPTARRWRGSYPVR
jgi:hypothetical protein